MKRIISLILAVLITCTCLPTSLFASAEGGDENTFIFPSSLTTIEEQAFAGNTQVSTMVVPNTVTTISSRAFEGCTGLTEVAIPSRDISIADDAFDGCSKDIVFYAYNGSDAMLWAMAHGYVCVPLDDDSDYLARFQALIARSGFDSGILMAPGCESKCLIVRTNSGENRLPDISAYHPIDIVRSDSNLYYIQFAEVYEAEDCLAMLLNHDIILDAEPDRVGADNDVFAQSVTIAENWGTNDVMGFDEYAPFVADHASGNVTVAVIDSGVSQSAWSGKFSSYATSFVGGSAYSDSVRHGSKVASIINDCLGINAGRVTLLPIKVVNSSSMYRTSVIIEGIKHAVAHDADIINLSLGWDVSAGTSPEIERQIGYANAKGIHVVAAAGNGSGQVMFPANCSGVLAVSALTYSTATGYVVKSRTGSSIDYTAPGLHLTTSAYPSVDVAGDITGAASTSFAAPQISAALALIELDSTRNSNAVSVLNSCCETEALSEDGVTNSQYGRGLPQLDRLVETDIILNNMDGGPIPAHLWLGDKENNFLLTWEIIPDYVDDKTVMITSSDASVLSVQCFGNTHALITAKGVGTAAIAVSNKDVTKQLEVTVEQPVLEILITGAEDQLIIGKTLQLAAAALPDNASNRTVVWESSDSTIAEVSANGLVTAKKTGIVTITCKAQDGYGTCAQVEIEVIDIPDPSGIVLTAKEQDISSGTVTLEVGDSLTIEAAVLPAEAEQTVHFSVFPQNILKHDGHGVFTASNPGTATIVVTAAANAGVSAGVSVTVVILPESVDVTAAKTTLDIGDTTVMTGMILPDTASNKAITWISSNPTIATVHSSTGLVTAVAHGTVEITGITCNGIRDSVTLTVRKPITITFDSNDGVCGESARVAYSGYEIGTLPNAQRNYYLFDGWYTDNGTRASADSIFTASTTLYAHWTGLPYDVMFDANGGECTLTKMSARVGEKLGSLPTATMPNYTFRGWYTTADEVNGVEVTPDYVQDTTEELWLFAHWTANPYTLKFNANGGNCDTASKTGTVDSPIGVLPEATRDGYSFDGWFTSDGTQITEKYVQSTTDDITVYAHWSPLPYQMFFDANEGTCTPAVIDCFVDTPVGELPVPTRPYYTFTGWYISGENQIHVTPTYQQSAATDVTVVARWAANPYTITFDPTEGSCTTVSQTAYVDSHVGVLPEPTRAYYDFVGWFKADGTPVTQAYIHQTDESMTLYARWASHPYTMWFNANDGNCTTNYIDGYVDISIGTLPTPTRDYYTFLGWFTAPNGGTQITRDYKHPTDQNITVYAQWKPQTYSIVLNANGGSGSTTAMTGTVDVAIGTLPTPTREYYTFADWHTAGGSTVDASYMQSTTATLNLYAYWNPMPYTMQFNANGGSCGTSAKKFYVDTAVSALPTPTRNYYTFQGWYTATSNGTKITASYKHPTTDTITVYAMWEPHTYTMYFNTNGGVCSTSSKTGKVDTAIGTLPTPTRDYYIFDGWWTTPSGTGGRISESWSQSTSASVTMYARWTLKPEKGPVLESALPSGAQVTQTLWSYRQHTETHASALDGWIPNGFWWQQIGSGSTNYATFPSGYDKSNEYYTTFAKAPYTASETTTTKREVTNKWAGYIYWHWMYSRTYSSTSTEIRISSKKGEYNAKGEAGSGSEYYNYKNFYAIASPVNCPYLSNGYCCGANMASYNCKSIIPSGADTSKIGTIRFFRFDYYTSSYIDYAKVFMYYRDFEYQTSDPGNGTDITNKVKYVKYREK